MLLNFFKNSLILILLLIKFTAFSQLSSGFIPNQNQWNKNVIYKTNIFGGAMFLEKNGFTFRFVEPINKYHHHKSNGDYQKFTGKLKSHAYKVEFLNSNKKSTITSENPSKMSYNFLYGQNKSNWVSNLKDYKTVNYTDLYPNINMNCIQNNTEIKYEFIVLPYANYKEIKFKISGAEKVYLNNENLIIVTTLGEVIETKPYVYQKINGLEREINSSFILKNNIISFKIDNYNANDTLIIDPTLVFSTYSGSTADNWGFTATYDYDGYVYSGGIVMGIGYPDTLGPSLMDFAGGADFPENTDYSYGWDIGIIKYDSLGQGIFATYLGGNDSEMPHSMIVNEFNQLIIFGTTGSTNFPVSENAYDKTFNGGESIDYDGVVRFTQGIDIFVSRISTDGSLILASTYIGGSENDGLNFKAGSSEGNSLYWNYGDGARGELITDDLNNIYIGTCTYSNDFPAGIGHGFKPNYRGNLDGVVFKMDYNLSNIVWSSYIGGSQDDAIYSIDVDSKYDVYISGGTASFDFPVTSDAFDESYNGGSADGFVSHITRNGSQLVGSTFYGHTNYDQAFFVRTDKLDNVYITGQTVESSGALVYNANYNIPNSGQFIAKFSKLLDELIWSTEFGKGDGKTNISPTAFAVDICNRIYFSGWGTDWGVGSSDPNFGLKGMQTTPDAISSVTDGQDFYILVLLDDASALDYATFFGEQYYSSCAFSGHDHVDGGTSRFDKYGNIYQSVCASCGGCQAFPTTSGAWSQTNNAANCNNAIFKINIHYDFADADFTYPNSGISPFNAQFTNTSTGTSYIWDFGDSSEVSNEISPEHIYTTAGVYNITLIANDPTSCNLSDTVVKQIVIMSDTIIYLDDIYICQGDFVQIGLNPISDTSISYFWSPSETLSDYTISNPFAFPNQTTQYTMLMNNGFVTDTVYQKVIVLNNSVTVNAGNDSTICKGNTINLIATSNSSINKYIWSSNLLFSDTLNVKFRDIATVIPLSTRTYYVKAFDTICNYFNIDSILVKLSDFKIQLNDSIKVCKNDTNSIEAINLNATIISYSWSPSSIIVSENNEQVNIVCSENSKLYGTFTNQFGCTTADSVIISVNQVTIDTIISDLSCFNSCTGKASLKISKGIKPFDYLWSNGDKSSETDSLCFGNISVTITDSLNCTINSSISINSNTMLDIITNIQDATCDNNCNGKASITVLDGNEPITFFIDNKQVDNEISELCEGIYIIKIIDSLNCILLDTLIIKLSLEEIAMPNVISPNGDGINDYLLIENECKYHLEFTVFSRWGAIIYNSNSEIIQWNGFTNAGIKVSTGVYYYIIKSSENVDRFSKAGYIHVMY